MMEQPIKKTKGQVAFEDFVSLVVSMSREEYKACRSFVVALDASQSKNSAQLKLLEFVRSHSEISYSKTYDRIGGGIKVASFDRLVSRVEQKLLETLTLLANTQRETQYSEHGRAQFRVTSRIQQALLLGRKGLKDRFCKELSSIANEAYHYELFDDEVRALRYLSGIYATQMKLEARKETKVKLAAAEQRMNSLNRALDVYYDIAAAQTFTGTKRLAFGNSIPALIQLQEAYKESGSRRVLYFYLSLGAEYYISIDEYQLAAFALEQNLRNVESADHIFDRRYAGSVLLDLAVVNNHTFKFEESVVRALEAESLLNRNEQNKNVASEVFGISLVYCNRFAEASECFAQLIERTNYQTNKFLHSKRIYLKAYSDFCLGKFQTAYVALAETSEIEKDRQGWNIGIRILTLLCKIELVLHESAAAHIESMRKFIERLKCELNPVRARDQIIFEILRRLEQHDFDFKLVNHNYRLELAKLRSTKSGLRWEPQTHELIPFQEWFQSKLENRPMRFQVSQQLIDWAQAERNKAEHRVEFH